MSISNRSKTRQAFAGVGLSLLMATGAALAQTQTPITSSSSNN